MQINNKNKQWDSPCWSIEYPWEWEAEQNEDCITFYNSDGIGALQISSYRKDEQILESEVFDFAADAITDISKLRRIKEENYQGFTVAYIENKTFWKRYYIWQDKIMILVTYNCDAKDKDSEEIEEVERILKTLKLKNIA